jgi:hypothetical protein
MSQRYAGAASTPGLIATPSNTTHTAMAWAYVQDNAAADIAYLDTTGGASSASAIWLGIDGGGNWVWQDNYSLGTNYQYSQATTANSWHHLAYTYDGTTSKAYLDGVVVNSSTLTNIAGRAAFNHMDFGFGGGTNGLTLQDVMYFTSALTQGQIQDCMRTRQPGAVPSASLYCWYPLPAGPAVLTDFSGFAHSLDRGGDADGTLFAPVTWVKGNNPQMRVFLNSTSVTETLTATVLTSGTVTDTVQVSETIAATVLTSAAVSNTAQASETIAATVNTSATVTNTVQVSEAVAATVRTSATAVDTVSVTESASATVLTSASVVDTVSVSESLTATVLTSAPAIVDTVTATQTLAATVLTSGTVVNVTGNTAIGTVLTSGAVTDTVSVTESATSITLTSATAADTVSVSQALAATVRTSASVSNVVSIVELIQATTITSGSVVNTSGGGGGTSAASRRRVARRMTALGAGFRRRIR